jgi:hypothetical protein
MANPTGVTAMGGEALSERAQAMLAAGLAASSQATYASGVARFHAFCDENRVPIERREPASENLLIEFVAALGGTVTPPTIRNYLSAIRAQHIAAGFGDPLAGRLRLQRAMRGVRRTYGEPRRLRLPITIDILRRIMVPRADDEWQDALFDAAITLGFFGFLRAGEFTIKTKRFAADIHPCIGDIVFQQAGVNAVSAMTFRIKVAKTDPFRQGSTVVIGASSKQDGCPVRAMLRYLHLRREHHESASQADALFVFADGTPLQYSTFIQMLDARLTAAGLDTKGYSGHSLRIGAATTAAAAGVPDWLIKVMGRWQSDCYQRYISTPVATVRGVSSSLALASVGATTRVFDPDASEAGPAQ